MYILYYIYCIYILYYIILYCIVLSCVVLYTYINHAYMVQASNPSHPLMSWLWSCMYAVCRRLYVRYSLHTPPPCGMGGG